MKNLLCYQQQYTTWHLTMPSSIASSELARISNNDSEAMARV